MLSMTPTERTSTSSSSTATPSRSHSNLPTLVEELPQVRIHLFTPPLRLVNAHQYVDKQEQTRDIVSRDYSIYQSSIFFRGKLNIGSEIT
jgi:hypothetical protein